MARTFCITIGVAKSKQPNGKVQFQLSLSKFDGFHCSNLGKEQVSMANNQKHIGFEMLHAISPSIFQRACAREACKQHNGHRSSFSSQETGHNFTSGNKYGQLMVDRC